MNSNKANFQKEMKKSVFMISNILIFELFFYFLSLFFLLILIFRLYLFFLTFSSCLIASQTGNVCDIH